MLGAAGMLLEVKPLYILLFFTHSVQSLLFDNPWVAEKQNMFESKLRAMLFDIIMIGALLMAMGSSISRRPKMSEAERKRRVEEELLKLKKEQ